MTTLRDLLKRIRQWDALDIPNSDGAFWKREIDAALEQPEQAEPVAWMYVGLTVTNNMHGPHLVWKPEQMDAMSAEKGVVASPLYTHPPRRETEPAAFDALVAISLLTHLGGEVAEYADVVEAVRRLHALNGELGAALRRLISYCNTLENRLLEADGEHPAVQEAKEAWAKVEGKV